MAQFIFVHKKKAPPNSDVKVQLLININTIIFIEESVHGSIIHATNDTYYVIESPFEIKQQLS